VVRACLVGRRNTEGSAKSSTAKNPATLKIWRPADSESIELREGTSFEHPYPSRWHEEFFIAAIAAQTGHFHHRGAHRFATTGAVMLVARGEIHFH
jgi:hypothetical protein